MDDPDPPTCPSPPSAPSRQNPIRPDPLLPQLLLPISTQIRHHHRPIYPLVGHSPPHSQVSASSEPPMLLPVLRSGHQRLRPSMARTRAAAAPAPVPGLASTALRRRPLRVWRPPSPSLPQVRRTSNFAGRCPPHRPHARLAAFPPRPFLSTRNAARWGGQSSVGGPTRMKIYSPTSRSAIALLRRTWRPLAGR